MVDKISRKNTTGFFSVNSPKESVPVQDSEGINFSRIFQNKVSQNELHEEFRSLLDLGEAIKMNLNLEDVLEYKKKIKSFIKKMMEFCSQEEGEDFSRREHREKIISKLNLELEELTSILKEEQREAIVILNKLDGIRGLLVDLYS